MRIVFLGTPRAAVDSLDALVEAGHEVALVVTRPDRRGKRSSELVPPPVRRAADRLGIEAHQPTRVRHAAFLDRLSSARPDALVVVAYGRILPAPVLEIARHGAINLHFSLLPAYRGAAPVQWALIRGESRTGVSTMRINEQMDEGDVLLQQELVIDPHEHAPSLTDRLAATGARLLVETLDRLEAGGIEPRPQDPERATYAPIIRGDEGRIDPSLLSAEEVEGRIRGLDPWPGVWLARRGRRVRLVEACRLDEPASAQRSGTIVASGGGVALVCRDGTLLDLRRIQVEGRRVMDARDAVNGRQIAAGDLLAPLGV